MTRELLAHINGDLVGTLREDQGTWSFAYDPLWVDTGFDLSPVLARTRGEIVDSGGVRPVQWYFDNLLPEDAARIHITASVAQDGGGVDAWDLLAHLGTESAGALSLLPPGAGQAEEGERALPDADLEQRILAMARQPLLANAPKKMALAGAQQKLAVVLGDNGELAEPAGARLSTHILKPNLLTEHQPCSAVNEWFCARLAQELGLPVAPVQLRYVPSSVYLIERYDRVRTARGIQCLHTIDAAQLLSWSAGARYAKPGAAALADIIALCRIKASTRVALFRWTLFNLLIGNSDAHLKNISLVANRDGYFLAPHYDLLSTAAWSTRALAGPGDAVWPEVALSFPVGGARRYDQLNWGHVVALAARLGLRGTSVQREFDRLVLRVEAAADRLYAEFEARTDVPFAQREAELHMLRTIRDRPIRDVVALLSR